MCATGAVGDAVLRTHLAEHIDVSRLIGIAVRRIDRISRDEIGFAVPIEIADRDALPSQIADVVGRRSAGHTGHIRRAGRCRVAQPKDPQALSRSDRGRMGIPGARRNHFGARGVRDAKRRLSRFQRRRPGLSQAISRRSIRRHGLQRIAISRYSSNGFRVVRAL